MTQILMLCGCLEPGLDGVADHVLRLSEELVRLGYEITALALADPFINQRQDYRHIGIRILRFPTSLSRQASYRWALTVASEDQPDLVIWHYVPWSYDRYGVPGKHTTQFARCMARHSLTMMMHELWVWNLDKVLHRQSVKEQVLGWAQRQRIVRLLKSSDRIKVSTSNSQYAAMLSRTNVEADIWPMFSNIPPRASNPRRATKPIRVAFFGTPRHNFPFARTIQPLLELAEDAKTEIMVDCVGRHEKRGTALIAAWRSELPGLTWVEHGPLSAVDASRVLSQCTYAVAHHPAHAIGRSGSAAAYLEHGLTVLVPFGKLDENDVFTRHWRDKLLGPEECSLSRLRAVCDEIGESLLPMVCAKISALTDHKDGLS